MCRAKTQGNSQIFMSPVAHRQMQNFNPFKVLPPFLLSRSAKEEKAKSFVHAPIWHWSWTVVVYRQLYMLTIWDTFTSQNNYCTSSFHKVITGEWCEESRSDCVKECHAVHVCPHKHLCPFCLILLYTFVLCFHSTFHLIDTLAKRTQHWTLNIRLEIWKKRRKSTKQKLSKLIYYLAKKCNALY